MRLISNEFPISRDSAWKSHKEDFLLFTWRVCQYCNLDFNITSKGIFYWCGCDKNEEN